ncbi:MAG: hypothetical protein U0990_06335 [Candidatus Nanopelagicales bacterium]|nr:hypothetical protein [Candidatus Nanopelagicales bacterium]
MTGDFILDPDGSVPTTLGAGGASGITALDPLLSYYGDDYFNEWFIILPTGPTDGNGSYEVTRVVEFTSTGGVLTLEPDASALVASGQSYELHRYNPAWKHLALNAARLQASDALALTEIDETLVVDNLIATNHDFETDVSGGESTGWTRVNAPTLTDETTQRMHGDNALSVAAGVSVGRVYQALTIRVNEVVNKTLTFRAWVYATEASAARIAISFDGGTTFTYSEYHEGSDQWEDLQVNAQVEADATSIRVYLEVTANETAFFDLTRAWVGRIDTYTTPTNLYRGATMVEIQTDMLDPRESFYVMTRQNPPRSGRIMRLYGKRLFSEVTTETGTMQVSDPESQILYAHALEWLANSGIGMASGVPREQFERDRQRWREVAAELRIRPGIKRTPPPYHAEKNGVWKNRQSGETWFLDLKNR